MTTDYSTLSHVTPVLTNEVVSEALRKWFQKPIAFTHWQFVSEPGKGDSYLSEVIRIKIFGKDQQGKIQNVQVVMKNIPKSISRRLTCRCDEFFKNEINFYTKILPKLLEFQSKKTMKEPFDKYVKIFYSYCDGVNDVICLEDASLGNFETAVRQDGMDFDHCKMCLKGLAQFHAMSFAMKDQNPEGFEEIRKELIETYYHERLWDWHRRFWKRISGIAIDAVEKEYPKTVYVDKIKQFAVPERYQDMIDAATKTIETGVISHGDSWTTNFLFKYSNGCPVDVKLIDFQLSRCSSPVLDLSTFIYSCTNQHLREKYFDQLLDYYYEVLATQIRDMGSDPAKLYPRHLFWDEIRKYSYYGLAFSFESTPFSVLAPEDALDMEMEGDQVLNIDDVWLLQPFQTKDGRLREADNVVHCVDRGFI